MEGFPRRNISFNCVLFQLKRDITLKNVNKDNQIQSREINTKNLVKEDN